MKQKLPACQQGTGTTIAARRAMKLATLSKYLVVTAIVLGVVPAYADTIWSGYTDTDDLSKGFMNACGKPKGEQKKRFLKAFKEYQSEARNFSAKAKLSDEKYSPVLDKAIANLANDQEIVDIFRREQKRLTKTSRSWIDFYNELESALHKKISKAFGSNPSIGISIEKECYCDVPSLSSQISITSTKLPLFISPVHLFSDDTRVVTLAANPENKQSRIEFRVRLTMSTQEQFERQSTFKVEELGKRLSGIALNFSKERGYSEQYGYFPWIEFYGPSNGYDELRKPETKKEVDAVYNALFNDELLDRTADELAVKMGRTLIWEGRYLNDYLSETDLDDRLVDDVLWHDYDPKLDPAKKSLVKKDLFRKFKTDSQTCGTQLDRAFDKISYEMELERAESESASAL